VTLEQMDKDPERLSRATPTGKRTSPECKTSAGALTLPLKFFNSAQVHVGSAEVQPGEHRRAPSILSRIVSMRFEAFRTWTI